MTHISSAGQATTQSAKGLSQKDLEAVKRLENEQSNFRNLVGSSREYTETEKAAVNVTTVAEFDALWQNTNNAKDDFDQSHETGCGLCSKTYQSSAVVVRSFMKDFSPILEIVQNIAAPYGGMAVGTISVLFVVAANKDEMEESLASAISGIRDRLPGLNLYQHIYNESHELDMRLQAQIVSAYQGFVEFCIEASKYYKGSGPRRWLKALGRPNGILKKAESVQVTMVEIRRLCDELLDKTVHSIKQINLKLDKDVQTVMQLNAEQKNTIEKLQKSLDDNTLAEIQRILNLSDFSEETQSKELEQYREALQSDEQLNAAYFEQMRGPRLDQFKTCDDYISWINSDHSSMLILSGYNNKSIVYLDQCWLSPIATAMITDLRLDSSHPIYSYYIFKPQGSSLYRPLSVILLQLLRQKSQILRDASQYDELRAELFEMQRCKHEIGPTEDEGLLALRNVALRVVGFFDESETVHVVLDRLDRCCDLKKRVDHRKPFLKALVRMVEAARCKLKVLVVFNGYQWSVEQDELEEHVGGRVILHTVEQGFSV